MGEPVDKAIAALAARQHGYVTRAQLLELGLGPGAVRHRVSLGRLITVYAGVYAAGHLPTSGVDRAAGAVLACGPGAVLSHGSAAALWGLRKRWSGPVEVTTRSARRRRGIRVHRSVALTRGDVRRHLGIRVTSPARTILDVAPSLDDRGLTRIVNEARLSQHLRLPDLAELIDRCPRHPGASRLRPFVRKPAGPTRSQLEDEFLAFTQRFALPRPKLNATANGREVDALFEAERVIVELDGFAYHSSRTTFENDRNRDADTLAAGFETVRVTWARLTTTPRHEARRLETILRRRHSAPGASHP